MTGPRRTFRRLVVIAAWCAGAAGAVVVVARVSGSVRVPALVAFGAAAVVFAIVVAIGRIREATGAAHDARPRPEGEPSPFALPARPYGRARHFEERLDLVRGDAQHFVQVVLPELRALADERLLVTRGITTASDPARAAVALGPHLQAFLAADTRTRAPSRRELDAIVTELEKL